MISWSPESIADISPIPPTLAPKKLWKHFYSPREHWDRLCDVNIEAWRQEAEELIGFTREAHEVPPHVHHRIWQEVKPLFDEHHEHGYGPVYVSELADTRTNLAPSSDDFSRTIALTPRSVFIVIDHGSNDHWIVTAFRPLPRRKSVSFTEYEIQACADQTFQNNTMQHHTYTEAVAKWLERASDPASTADDLWWIAFAIGRARMLADDPHITALLAGAESALTSSPKNLFRELAELLEFEACIEDLSCGLEQERPEDFELALEGAEELLVVAEVIGANEKSTRFLDDLEAIIPWVPAEWSHLRARARNHAIMLDEESNARRFWEFVEDCIIAACVMEEEPAVKPTPHLYKKLLPTTKPWAQMLDQLSKLAGSIAEAVEVPLSQLVDSFQVMKPAPLMGSTSGEQRELRARMPALSHMRVFVVDEEHPEGFDVTGYIEQTPSHFWTLEGGERALVVFIVSEAPLAHGASLGELLALASEREDMAVTTREV